MSGHGVPYTSAVINRACTELLMHNERKLSQELAAIGRAVNTLANEYANRPISAKTDDIGAWMQRTDAAWRVLHGLEKGLVTADAALARAYAVENAAPAIDLVRELRRKRSTAIDPNGDP